MIDKKTVIKLVDVFNSTKDRRLRLSVIKKFSGIPIKHLSKYKREIPDNIKSGIVQIILQQDGVKSTFVPAELAEFAYGENVDPSPLGLRVRTDVGNVPEEFEDTGVPEVLAMQLEPRISHPPSAEELKNRNLK